MCKIVCVTRRKRERDCEEDEREIGRERERLSEDETEIGRERERLCED